MKGPNLTVLLCVFIFSFTTHAALINFDLASFIPCQSNQGCDLITALRLTPSASDDLVLSTSTNGIFKAYFSIALAANSIVLTPSAGASIILSSAGQLTGSIVTNQLKVGVNNTLVSSGNTVVNAVAEVNGTVVITNAAFNGGMKLADGATLSLSSSASVTVSSQATLDGSVYLAQNANLFLNAAGSRIANLIITGTDTIVRGASATVTTIYNNVTVAVASDLILVDIYGSLMVGSQTTSSAYFQAGVYVAGSGSVVVSSASTLALWGNCTINGDLSLASTASLWVYNQTTTVARNAATAAQSRIVVLGNAVLSFVASSSFSLAGSLLIGTSTDGSSGSGSGSGSASVSFYSTASVSSGGSITLGTNAALYMYAASNVGGIVYLTQNSLVWASSSSQRIATVVVSGTNNTIQAVQGDVMTIATNVTVAASSSLNLVGQITVQAAVNILKCSSSPFLSLPLSFFPPAPHSSLQSFFDHVASVQGSTTFGQSTATSAAVGATVTGSTVVNNGGSLVFYGTNYITGSVVLYASSLLVAGGTTVLNVSSTTYADATSTITTTGSSALIISGQLTSNNTIAAQGQSTVTIGSSYNGGVQTASGTSITVNGGASLILNYNSTIAGSLNLLANSIFVVQAGTTSVSTAVLAYGTTTVRGVLVFTDTTKAYTQPQGTLILDNGIVAASSVQIGAFGSTQASLVGNGAINGNLYVYASLSIGNSPGVMYPYVSGNCIFESSSTFNLELANSSTYDKLCCGGNAQYAGILAVTLLNQFVATANDSFSFVNFNGTGSGAFSAVTRPFSVNYQAHATVLTSSSSSTSSPTSSSSSPTGTGASSSTTTTTSSSSSSLSFAHFYLSFATLLLVWVML